jgi:plasmid maintenance system antidote protein VapI
MVRIPTDRHPTHPGEMLLEAFLQPMHITRRELATDIASASTKSSAQLSDLLARNAAGIISADETATLDQLLAQIDQLNLLKARAQYTLHYLNRVA